MPRYSICIATYKRPEGLSLLLESIEAQELDLDDSVEIIIVDNDPPSAQGLVAEFAAASRFPIRYLTQPEQNISTTRNLAVHEATGDYVWFVDDDEVAIPECLSRLGKAMSDFDADGVFGPVIPQFESKQPEWMESSSLFNRAIGVTGRRSEVYRTSNTLVKRELLLTIPGPFDPNFGISGGSDSLLFRQLANNGAFFIDSSDAIVYEDVPDSRADWYWMKTRMRRQGQNYTRQIVMTNGGVVNTSVAWMLAKAAVQIPGSVLGWAVSRDSEARKREFQLRLWSNIGKFEGLAGTISVRME